MLIAFWILLSLNNKHCELSNYLNGIVTLLDHNFRNEQLVIQMLNSNIQFIFPLYFSGVLFQFYFLEKEDKS